MMSDSQRRVDDLIALADSARQGGLAEIARQRYQEAALLEEAALSAVPAEAQKTRGIIASSVATLYAQAHDYDHARRFIYQYLGSASLTSHAEKRLEDVLTFVLDRIKLRENNEEYADDALGIALRGGNVGFGTAPADTVVNAMKSWQALVIRFAESSLDLPYRPRGPASSALLQAVSPRVSQPTAGSFKFDLRLAKDQQSSLLEAKEVDNLVDEVALLIRATAIGDRDYVEKRVPKKQYRETILELVKSVIPTGRAVREAGVTVRRYGKSSDLEDVVLRPELRVELTTLIRATRRPASSEVQIIEGVLRGLELDHQWISIDLETNRSVRLKIDSESLEDVIGMMVNQTVRVEAEQSDSGALSVLEIDLLD